MDTNTFSTSIIRLRTQGEGIMEYWLYKEDPLLLRVSEFMNRPIFTAGQMPVSYRVLNHWGNSGLLPEGILSDGTWRKLTFVERVWVGVVAHLREFGVPLENIANAKKQILKFDKKCKGYVLFEYYISRAVATTDDPYVLILSDGRADIANFEEIEIHKQGIEPTDMILISLKSVLTSLGVEAYSTLPLVSLTEDELAIFEALRVGDNDELLVKMRDGKIVETQSSKSKHGKPKLADVMSELKKGKAYADVTIKLQDGVPEMVKVSKKRRPKSKPSE